MDSYNLALRYRSPLISNHGKIPEIKIKLSFDKDLKPSQLRQIRSTDDAAATFREVFDADRFEWTEEFVMLCLNRRNGVVGFYKVASGGIDRCSVDPRVILTVALNCGATQILIAHNHPSGSTKPSKSDEVMTAKIKTACDYLDIKLLDHIILTTDSFYSFADEGLI